MTVLRTSDTQLRYNLLVLFAAGLLFWSSMASLLPTLPIYLRQLGTNRQEIGIVMGSFAVGLLLFRPWLGRLADRRGRKIVLLIGTLVAAIAPLGYLTIKSIPLLMLLRAFHGISIAAFATGFNALVADIAPPEKRGEIIGYMSLVNPIGFAIGPALGGYLQSEASNKVLFLITAELALVAVLGIFPIVNPPLPKLKRTDAKDNQFWKILLSPRVRTPAIIMLLIGLAGSAIHIFIPLFIKEAKIALNPGLFFTAAAISGFGIRLFIGKASDRLGRGLFITISLVFYTLSMLILWLAYTPPTVLLAAVVDGAASGTLIPAITAMMADRAKPQERGQIFALCLLGLDVGIAIAGLMFGWFTHHFGYRKMFLVSAFLTFLGFFFFLTQSSNSLGSSLRFALGREADNYAIKKV
ncbi:MFS transporter [Scytonema hofmannii PCC 7110]|uniref:MFS transporter n=1 Tax=Scytonema hofmannii PCC 7110 TaxID=128403 RepID=A0A139X6H4_9CYAN|nr:MFS transporter [Scytonema hofmannii]KYC40317.1 MFS transporter [Scytonema hofmannii PCC 7110]